MHMPDDARPHEVAILRMYLLESSDPKEIAILLHYKRPQPVYQVIRKYRDFLANHRVAIYTGSITVQL